MFTEAKGIDAIVTAKVAMRHDRERERWFVMPAIEYKHRSKLNRVTIKQTGHGNTLVLAWQPAFPWFFSPWLQRPVALLSLRYLATLTR